MFVITVIIENEEKSEKFKDCLLFINFKQLYIEVGNWLRKRA